ncbi:MAG: hypothetical protein EH225_03420 [Calditrichaeota bacterium]|nr:MAG: hypothetical protein EH225_03420 [Calditrichota bacterium]
MLNRRDFLKTFSVTPLLLQTLVRAEIETPTRYTAGNPAGFEILEIQGSYRQIGYETGKRFGSYIKQVIKKRFPWHENLMKILHTTQGRVQSQEYLRFTRTHFPHLLEELQGLADGAGLHFDAIWAICIKSELTASEKEPDGCSTITYRDENENWLFHNEDGDVAYHGKMFLLKATPPSGVSYLSLVYPGTLTGNGPSLNDHGIFQTTNYISSTAAEMGIPRYVLGRAVLEAQNLQEAADMVSLEPRAYPYHHNIGSFVEKKLLSIETTPETMQKIEPESLSCHTNHLIGEKTVHYDKQDPEYRKSSSLSRYKVIREELSRLHNQEYKPELFLNMLSSHKNAPYSPCRHPAGSVTGITLATAFVDINRGFMRLYKGQPCRAVPDKLYREYKMGNLG